MKQLDFLTCVVLKKIESEIWIVAMLLERDVLL